MTPEYDGKTERRQDGASVRLALLESNFANLKESQVAIHKRITDFKSEIKEDMRVGFRDLKDEIHEFFEKSEAKCTLCSGGFEKRLSIIERWRAWITGGYVTLAAVFSLWVNHKGKP